MKGLIFLAFLFCSCASNKQILKALAEENKTLQHHIGFYLYDPAAKAEMVNYNGNKYFTPASNTKVLTLCTALYLLGDSLTAFRYAVSGDSTIVTGLCDPSFLNPAVCQNKNVFLFLKNAPGKLYFDHSNNKYIEPFGPGWAWDDYSYSFSPERNSFPVYGNVATLRRKGQTWSASPTFFAKKIVYEPQGGKAEKIVRQQAGNEIRIQRGKKRMSSAIHLPFHVDGKLIADLLSDTLRREVQAVDKPAARNGMLLRSVPADSVYKVMMKDSDNHLAEELLLQCAALKCDTLQTEKIIRYAKKHIFSLPDSIAWVDGSGLSRYNLFTPRTLVKVWEMIDHRADRHRIWSWLATGGKDGTLKNNYVSDTPFIFGKTGTLSNNHSLSGYLITKKGRVLLFSFMNNNYTQPVSEVRAFMERTLRTIHKKF